MIGRTKLSDIELPDDIKPANSHVAENTIIGPRRDRAADRAGEHAVRHGRPGRVRHLLHRLLSHACSVTEQMLENMFIGNPPGNTDRVLDFSTAVTGTLFFVPTADFLDDPPDPPALGAAAGAAGGTAGAQPAAASDGLDVRAGAPDVRSGGSLGIGSLKRSVPS